MNICIYAYMHVYLILERHRLGPFSPLIRRQHPSPAAGHEGTKVIAISARVARSHHWNSRSCCSAALCRSGESHCTIPLFLQKGNDNYPALQVAR